MKPTLNVGDVAALTAVVGPDQTISLGGQDDATVFSTPSMIHLMEHAARELLRPHLDPGEESVGIDVHIEHSSATPPGATVTAEATVTMMEKNVIGFAVVARDPWGEIGQGTHRRAVIKTDGFAARLAEQKPMQSKLVVTEQPVGVGLPSLECIQLQHDGRQLSVMLNRPGKRNAIDSQMTAEMERLVDWLAVNAEAVGVVVVSGAGDTFCAGDDVTDLQPQQSQPQQSQSSAALSLRRGELYERITRLPQIWIAEVSGSALGGGLILACACDFRVASHQATFGLTEVRLGWPPNYGLRIVESLIGRGVAMQLALTGRILSARDAESCGLVHQVVAASQLQGAVQTMAQQFLELPTDAVAATKQLFGISDQRPGDKEATEAFIRCLQSAEASRSINRFQKR